MRIPENIFKIKDIIEITWYKKPGEIRKNIRQVIKITPDKITLKTILDINCKHPKTVIMGKYYPTDISKNKLINYNCEIKEL